MRSPIFRLAILGAALLAIVSGSAALPVQSPSAHGSADCDVCTEMVLQFKYELFSDVNGTDVKNRMWSTYEPCICSYFASEGLSSSCEAQLQVQMEAKLNETINNKYPNHLQVCEKAGYCSTSLTATSSSLLKSSSQMCDDIAAVVVQSLPDVLDIGSKMCATAASPEKCRDSLASCQQSATFNQGCGQQTCKVLGY